MTDDELVAELALLGVDEDSFRVIVLLPVVQVAWADGRIQPAEIELILQIAHHHGLADGAAGVVLERWLRALPDPEILARGRRVLVQLAHRQRGLGARLPDDTLSAVADMCAGVARAAGGLFDFLFTVEASERAALREITTALRLETEEILEVLPSPDGGRFEDL